MLTQNYVDTLISQFQHKLIEASNIETREIPTDRDGQEDDDGECTNLEASEFLTSQIIEKIEKDGQTVNEGGIVNDMTIFSVGDDKRWLCVPFMNAHDRDDSWSCSLELLED